MIFRISYQGVTRKFTLANDTDYTTLESQIQNRFQISPPFSLAYLEDGIEITLDSNEELIELLASASLAIYTMNIKVGQAGEVRSDTDESETESLFSHIEVEELLVEVEDKEKGKQKEIVTEQDERLQEETENTENIGMESFEDPPDHVAGSENINESAHTSTPLPESPIPNLANITSLLQSSFSRLTDTLSTNLALGDFLDAQKRSTAIVNIGMEVNSIIREVGESIRTEAEIIQRDFSTRMSDGTNAAADGQEEKNDAAGGEESNERQEEDISIPIPGAFDFDTPVDPILSQFDSHATGYQGRVLASTRSNPHHRHGQDHRAHHSNRSSFPHFSRPRSTQSANSSTMPGSFSFSRCPYPSSAYATASASTLRPTFPLYPPPSGSPPSPIIPLSVRKQELQNRLKEMGFNLNSMEVKIVISRIIAPENDGISMEMMLEKSLGMLI